MNQKTYELTIARVSNDIGYTDRLTEPIISLIERSRNNEPNLPETEEDLRKYLLACKKIENVRVYQDREENLENEDGSLKSDPMRITETGQSKFYFEEFVKSLYYKKDRFLVIAYYVRGYSFRKIESMGILGMKRDSIRRRLNSIAGEYETFLTIRGYEATDLNNSSLWADIESNGKTFHKYKPVEISTNFAPLRKYRNIGDEKDLTKFRDSSENTRQKHLKKDCQGLSSVLDHSLITWNEPEPKPFTPCQIIASKREIIDDGTLPCHAIAERLASRLPDHVRYDIDPILNECMR